MTVNNETCCFGGLAPVLNWSLHDAPAKQPSRRLMLACAALRNAGAEVRGPNYATNGNGSGGHWCAGVTVRAQPGTSAALAVGGLIARLDPDAFDGSVRPYPIPPAAVKP